jgi:hypothetical protein
MLSYIAVALTMMLVGIIFICRIRVLKSCPDA